MIPQRIEGVLGLLFSIFVLLDTVFTIRSMNNFILPYQIIRVEAQVTSIDIVGTGDTFILALANRKPLINVFSEKI